MRRLILALLLTLLLPLPAYAPHPLQVPVPAEQEHPMPTILIMTATAYSWGCGTGDNLTATMTPVREGVIAVDPQIIPLGSRVEILGLGVFVAEDVGGAIKGYKIDIWMNSQDKALQWGKKEVHVRVIANDSK